MTAIIKALLVLAISVLPPRCWDRASAFLRQIWPGVRHA